jgi:hypothetical protein
MACKGQYLELSIKTPGVCSFIIISLILCNKKKNGETNFGKMYPVLLLIAENESLTYTEDDIIHTSLQTLAGQRPTSKTDNRVYGRCPG